MTKGAESADLATLVNAIILDVCELPDRTSPDDRPEDVTLSVTELCGILEHHLEALAADNKGLREALDGARSSMSGWRLMELANGDHGVFISCDAEQFRQDFNAACSALSSPSSDRWRAERRVIEAARIYVAAENEGAFPSGDLPTVGEAYQALMDALAALPAARQED